MKWCAALLLAAVAMASSEDPAPGELGGWTSYPPVQDVGYDPSITPSDGWMLRIVRPPSTGPMRVGFLKRLDRVAAGPVRVSLNYRLKPAAAGAWVEVGLAGANGKRYAARLGSDGAVEFRDIPAGTGLEAMYVVAVIPDADPDFDYRFRMKNVKLDAVTAPAFDVLEPRAVKIASWKALVSEVTYEPGETISLNVKAPAAMTAVRCVLKDPDGRAVTSATLEGQGAGWKKAGFYTVGAGDVTGVWRVELTGTAAGGRKVETAVRVIVRAVRNERHPRLYFGADDRGALRARTEAPGLRDTWKHLMAQADKARAHERVNAGETMQLLDRQFLLPTLMAYFDIVMPLADRLRLHALKGFALDDAEARRTAKTALVDLAGWRRWEPPWFREHGQHTYYPVGELTMDAALAYDVLYNELSEPERVAVRRAFRERGIRDVYEEYVVNDRIPAGTSNWIGHVLGGALVASMAIDGEKDDPELNRMIGGLLLKLEDHLAASYLADGSYGESTGYEQFDMKSTGPMLEALDRVWGLDYWKRSHFKDSLRFPMYTLAWPPKESPDFGDGHGQTAYSAAPVVRRSGEASSRWYYSQFKHESTVDFLFPPEAAAGEPTEPPSTVFEQKGMTVFRTGWKPDDALLIFRAGPNFNHNHADQGSFQLRAFGEDLASEAGAAHYYNDPYYPTYFTQAEGHNTVLVDGDPASQDLGDTPQFRALNEHARMTTAITSAGYDAASGELAAVYRGRLDAYRRDIVFVKPGVVLIHDVLRARSKPATFEWLLHVKDKARLAESGGGYVYRAAGGQMDVTPLEPASPRISVTSGHLPHSVFNTVAPVNPPAEPGILRVHSGAAAQTGRFLVALRIGKQEPVERLTESGCTGARIGASRTYFRETGATRVTCGGWTTDAQHWTTSDSLLAASAVTTLAHNGRVVFTSDHPASFVLETGPGPLRLTVSAKEPTRVRITPDGGAPVDLQFSAGQHQQTIAR